MPLPPLDPNGRSSGGPALPAHPHPAVPAAQGPDPVAVGRAQAQARDTKTAVEVPELGGETWRTSVEPNGSLSSKRYLGVVNVHQGDQWLPVDTTLQQTADGLRGARTPSQVLFSPGGTGPAVTAVVRGHTIRMTWPRPLPAPTISGSTATYRQAAPGQDLVLTQTAESFEASVVVADPAAAAVPVELGLDTPDLTVVEAPDGLHLRDTAGTDVAAVPPALAADATGTVDRHDKRRALPMRAVKAAGRTRLLLQPDPTWLADPATRYPLTLDPALGWGFGDASKAADTYTTSAENFPHNTRTWMDVGGVGNGQAARAWDYWNVNDLVGTNATVNTAYVNMVNYNAGSCTTSPDPTQVWRITSPWDATTLTWYNQQPSTAYLGNSGETHGRCDAPNWVGWWVGSTVQGWVSQTSPNYGLAFSANNENDGRGFREYYATEHGGDGPYLYINYNSRPITAPSPVGLAAGDGTVTPSWTYPTNDGGDPILDYDLYLNDITAGTGTYTRYVVKDGTVQPTASGSTSLTGGARPAINGHQYYAFVLSCNDRACGPGAASATTTPSHYPSPVVGLSVRGSGQGVTATWSPPTDNGGTPVDVYDAWVYAAGGGYCYTASLAGQRAVVPQTSVTFGNLTDGQNYTVYVFPHNASPSAPYTNGCHEGTGYGPGSAASATAGLVPAAPGSAGSTAADGGVQITWPAVDPPPGDPGGTVTGYTVSAYRSGTTTPVATTTVSCPPSGTCATTTTLGGLANGTTYYATVAASNAAGTGAPAYSALYVPAGRPAAPLNVTADKRDQGGTGGAVLSDGFQVSWDPNGAAANGATVSNGATVGSYLVSSYACATPDPATCTADATHPDVRVAASGTGRQHSPTLTGYTHLATYAFSVRADNTTPNSTGTGTGPETRTAPATNYGTPTFNTGVFAPSGVKATPGDRTATVRIYPSTADALAQAITSYTITGTTTEDGHAQPRISIPGSGNPGPAVPANTTPQYDNGKPYYDVPVPNVVNGHPVTWTATANESAPLPGGTTVISGTSGPSPAVTTAGRAYAPEGPTATADTNPANGQPVASHTTHLEWNPPSPRCVDPDPANGTCTTTSSTSHDYASTPGNNGAPITAYTVYGSPARPDGTNTASTPDGNTTVLDFPGLKNSGTYTFVVTASNTTNAYGTAEGPASAGTNPAVPSWQPFKPGTPFQATPSCQSSATPLDGRVAVCFAAPPPTNDGQRGGTGDTPGNNGASIASYTVRAAATANQPSSCPGPAAGGPAVVSTANGSGDTGTVAASVGGLSNGCTYTVTVVASNKKGADVAGQTSSASAVILVAGAPDAPTNVAASGGDSTATLTWSPSVDHGTPVSGYTISASPALGNGSHNVACTGGSCSASDTTCSTTCSMTVSDVTNGTTYTFRIVAHSAAGDSPAAASSSVLVAGAPAAPGSVSATPADSRRR